MMRPPASWPASRTSRRPSWTVLMFDQGRNSSPTLTPARWASSARPANSVTQRSWSQAWSATSGPTLMCRAPSASAADRSLLRTMSDRCRAWPVGPPVGEELQLQVDEAVVLEHRANPGHAVVALGHEQVGVDQPESTKPRCGCGLDPLLQRDRALLVAAQRRRVTRGRPTSRQQILVTRQLVHAGQLRRAAVVPATAGTLCQAPSAAERSAAATTSAAARASSTEQLRRSPPVTATRNLLASVTLRSS